MLQFMAKAKEIEQRTKPSEEDSKGQKQRSLPVLWLARRQRRVAG